MFIILMTSKMSIIAKIQNNIMNNNPNISFSLSQKNKDKKIYTLLIYNPSSEYFHLNDNNMMFFKNLVKCYLILIKKQKKVVLINNIMIIVFV